MSAVLSCFITSLWLSLGTSEVVLRDNLTGETYCNSSTYGLQEYNFDGSLCQEDLMVFVNWTIVQSGGNLFNLDGEQVVSVENIAAGIVGGIKRNDSDHFYFEGDGPGVLLPDLNFSLPGISAWDPEGFTFWTVGDSNVGRQLKFYKVEARNNFTTGFYTIASGEPPVNVYWNGTDVIGIVERNSTYFTVAFLKSGRKTVLGSSLDSTVLIDRLTGTVNLLPRQDNISYLCNRQCHTIASATPTPSHQFTLPSIVVSGSATFAFHGLDVTINVPGRLIITEGTIVTLTISEGDFVTGDTITLFTYAEFQGSFAGLDLISDDSCQHYEGELQYTSGALNVVITAATNVCTAKALKIKLL